MIEMWSSLPSACQAVPWVLCSVLVPTNQESCRRIGEGPKEGHEDGQRDGELEETLEAVGLSPWAREDSDFITVFWYLKLQRGWRLSLHEKSGTWRRQGVTGTGQEGFHFNIRKNFNFFFFFAVRRLIPGATSARIWQSPYCWRYSRCNWTS